nr:hypothetical protein [Tanacetum cinerariifolium]
MSSPNHPTFNIEDSFSSNFPDYLPASSNYVPASPRKTYSSSSNSFGVVPIASSSLSLFHDDPYMKVMHAYYAEKSPIPPSIITPPSSIPNPQEFFLPEEFSLPKKKGHDQSSSSTFTLPQAFEIGESSPSAASASEAPAMTQAAIRKNSWSLKLSKLKGKLVVTEAVTLHPIDPELLKIDVAPLAPKLRNNRTVHIDYLRHTQEETATLREIVESERLLNPLNTSLYYTSNGCDSKEQRQED